MAAKEPRDKAPRRATMADVASRVGVSRQLVGLVFSGQPGVGPETEAKIRAVAKELGYRPNLAAQSLRSDSSKYIGIVFHPGESSMTELLPALYLEAKGYEFDLLLSAVGAEHAEQQAVDDLLGHRCSGLILIASSMSPTRLQAITKEVPLVSIGRRVDKVRCGIVASHGELGMEAAVDHLVALGHSKIAYVLGPEMLDAQYRLDGYLKAISRHGLKPDVVSIPGDFAEIGGAAAADELRSRKTLPTAVICNNDQSAMGLTHRFAQVGMQVPGDISVVGYDDTVAKYPFANFTTVRQDPKELAAAALRDLVARINGDLYFARTYLTSANLIIRTSTAAPAVSPTTK